MNADACKDVSRVYFEFCHRFVGQTQSRQLQIDAESWRPAKIVPFLL